MLKFVREFWVHFVVCALVCSAVYLPVVLSPFERHDDYLLDSTKIVANFRSEPSIYGAAIGVGRIFMTEIYYGMLLPLYSKFPTIQFHIILRVFDLFFVIVGFALFSYWMATVLRLDKKLSLAIALLITMFPGIQFTVAQGLAVSNSISIVFSFLALVVLNDARATGKFWEDIRSKRVIVSIFLLYLVCNDYQTNVILFLLGPVALLFLGHALPWNKKRSILLRHFIIYVSAMLLYVGITKLVFKPLYLHFYPQTVFPPLAVETHLAKLWANFQASFYRPRALNLWFLSDNSEKPGIYFVYFVYFTAFCFLIKQGRAHLRTKIQNVNYLKVLQFAALSCCFYLGIQSPHILYQTVYYFRVLYLYSAAFMFVLLWAVYFWCDVFFRNHAQKVFLGIACACCFLAAVLAQYNSMKYLGHLAMAEIDYLEASLQPLLNGQASQAIIQKPIGNIDIGGDEHGMLTSCFDNEYGLQGMIKRIYKRNGKDSAQLEFTRAPYHRFVAVVDHKLQKQGITQKIFVDMDVIYKILYVTYR